MLTFVIPFKVIIREKKQFPWSEDNMYCTITGNFKSIYCLDRILRAQGIGRGTANREGHCDITTSPKR